jgi:hypothetical protein
MKICVIDICAEATSGYNKYCEKHKRNLRRHGHPEQLGVTATKLKPYIKRVKSRMTKNSTNDTWRILTMRWAKVLEIASDRLLTYS